jgi:hypothetical protein
VDSTFGCFATQLQKQYAGNKLPVAKISGVQRYAQVAIRRLSHQVDLHIYGVTAAKQIQQISMPQANM